MGFAAAFVGAWLLLAQLDIPIAVVQAADAPVRLDRAKILNTNEAPLVLLYAATNLTGDELDQFTVMVFVFDREGRLKARQVAPGRAFPSAELPSPVSPSGAAAPRSP